MYNTITTYHITYDCKDGSKEFITIDPSEKDIKLIELFQDYEDITLSYSKSQKTKSEFNSELKRITKCI